MPSRCKASLRDGAEAKLEVARGVWQGRSLGEAWRRDGAEAMLAVARGACQGRALEEVCLAKQMARAVWVLKKEFRRRHQQLQQQRCRHSVCAALTKEIVP